MSEETPRVPALANAQLPASYQAAQKALAECSRVDECKDWSDKAQALASYARQAKDSTLHNLALRIQARAQRRMGELLKLIPQNPGGRPPELPAGGHPPAGETRAQVARDAGLSEHQRKTALRVASVPDAEFQSRVESPIPPTVTALARLGTAPCDLSRIPDPAPEVLPADPAIVVRTHRGLREFASFCAAHDPVAVARGAGDVDMLRGQVETISAWLDRFVVNLPESQGDAA